MSGDPLRSYSHVKLYISEHWYPDELPQECLRSRFDFLGGSSAKWMLLRAVGSLALRLVGKKWRKNKDSNSGEEQGQKVECPLWWRAVALGVRAAQPGIQLLCICFRAPWGRVLGWTPPRTGLGPQLFLWAWILAERLGILASPPRVGSVVSWIPNTISVKLFVFSGDFPN